MPYIFNWQNPEHTIIHVEMVGQVSWEEYSILTDRIVEALARTNQRIDLIYDDKVGMPKGNPMPHLKASSQRMSAYPNFGLIITVSTRSISSFTKVMIDIMARAYHIDNTHSGGFVSTMAEALSIIETNRAKEQSVK